ncbi:PorP/SprF family type IX secretion system membrane protein [Rhizosphaericola mali]|uniref:PorP/SprF family type IX secretion system membrane protein n=1 Tax=Rhizosphaericola mali TaxID=2545455 RepID=UPI001CDA3ED4|nr:PorP/SprF family type IX secretion system membrane protein [Rhizosphaericola mali]
MKVRHLLFILFSFLILQTSKAQDPHFSQYFASPFTVNPAFTGKFDGDYRIMGNFRNQWSQIDNGYQTYSAAIDMPILQNQMNDRDVLGIGFMGYSDKSANGAVSSNYFSFSTAFNKGLDDKGYQQLGLGLQGTYSNMMVNTSKLHFLDQLTPLGWTNLTSENFNNSTLKNHYLDLNAGLLYTYSTDESNNYYVGASMYHINKPKQNFTIGDFQINPRYTFNAGAYFPVGEELTLHVSGLHSIQSGTKETLLGGALQFHLNDEYNSVAPTNFFAGGWVRFGDAIIPYVGLEFLNTKLGLTYDINSSGSKTVTQSRNGVELSLQYIIKSNKTVNRHTPPQY